MKRVVIVGGGIAGLAMAYSLSQIASEREFQIDCTVLEQGQRFGGKIATHRRDGFVIEGGPDSFLAQKPRILEVCRELGLNERLIGTNATHAGVSVLYRGKMLAVPEGLLLVAPTKLWPFIRSPLFSWRAKLRMGLDLVIPQRQSDDDESVAAFIRRRLGREALDRLAQPLMAGIHVADPERLSMQAAFPRLVSIERQHGSLIRGMRAQSNLPTAVARGGPSPGSSFRRSGFLSLQGGMEELVEALTARLGNTLLLTGCRVVQISSDAAVGNPRYAVNLDDGTILRADVVVLATPATASARLVQSLSPGAAAALQGIRYVSTATISLGYRRRDVESPPRGSGFVVPKSEARAITAGTWSSAKFDGRAPADHLLLRVFVGGADKEGLVGMDDQALVSIVRAEVLEILGISADPVIVDVFRWPGGIPQYDVGHCARVAAIEGALSPGVFLVGAAYHGVGVPDCIANAHETAHRLVQYLGSAQDPDPEQRATWLAHSSMVVRSTIIDEPVQHFRPAP